MHFRECNKFSFCLSNTLMGFKFKCCLLALCCWMFYNILNLKMSTETCELIILIKKSVFLWQHGLFVAVIGPRFIGNMLLIILQYFKSENLNGDTLTNYFNSLISDPQTTWPLCRHWPLEMPHNQHRIPWIRVHKKFLTSGLVSSSLITSLSHHGSPVAMTLHCWAVVDSVHATAARPDGGGIQKRSCLTHWVDKNLAEFTLI